jgi:hypothetical protein
MGNFLRDPESIAQIFSARLTRFQNGKDARHLHAQAHSDDVGRFAERRQAFDFPGERSVFGNTFLASRWFVTAHLMMIRVAAPFSRYQQWLCP